jgi:phosphate-selective porin
MRSLTWFFVLLVSFTVPGSLAYAQGTQPASNAGGAKSASATEEEVNQLRREVAAQRQTIEELKATVGKLVQANGSGSGSSSLHVVADESNAHLVNTVLVDPSPGAEPVDAYPSTEAIVEQPQSPAAPKPAPLTAGWNGEHFFIRSADGQFSISPYGYVDTDYRAYTTGPANTFLVRRARFGFQGFYGKFFDFALLTDANSTSGAIIRDVYLNTKIKPEIQFQAGQFKEPFAQELSTGATNLDFVERGLQALLYPSVVTAFRSPGITLHGDIEHGAIQYFVGAFNGRGGVTAAVVNEPEIVGRVRLYPWRNTNKAKEKEWLRELAFGGSVAHADSRGLTGDVSFSGTLPDNSYAFFPQLRINGSIWRYEGEFTYLKGPFGLRAEYDQLQQQRDNVGSETPGGLGFLTLPGVGAKAWNISTTYLLTGEKQPENGTPRVKRPLFGPGTPEGGTGRGWGAWGLAVRYSAIQAIAPGANYLNLYTPGFVPTYSYNTDQVTLGFNWYLNYWVKYQFNFNINQIKQPTVTGQVPGNVYVFLQELQYRF